MNPFRPLLLSCLLPLGLLAAGVEVREGKSEPVLEPFAVDFAPDGTLYGVEFTKGNRVFKWADGAFHFVAGFKHASDIKKVDAAIGDGADAAKSSFNGLHDIAITADGRAFLADTFNHRIRVLDLKTGAVSTFAGNGTPGYSGDGGPARDATFNQPYCATLSPDKQTLLVADLANTRVRAIDLRDGTVRTIAGNGKRGMPVDGAKALESPLVGPRAVAQTPDGVVYIVLREGHALVELRDGVLRTVVNTSGKPGYSGDGGPGREAKLNGPKYLAVDAKGGVLVVDTENHALRRYDPASGVISLVAGTPPTASRAVGADALSTGLKRPHGVRIGPDGILWITDSENNRLVGVKP